MKKDFISLGNAQGIDLLIHLRVKHIKKTDMSNLFLILVIISILEVNPRKTSSGKCNDLPGTLRFLLRIPGASFFD